MIDLPRGLKTGPKEERKIERFQTTNIDDGRDWNLKNAQIKLFKECLLHFNFRVRVAAKAMGISHSKAYRLLEKTGLTNEL